jgi:hypothetical protein
VRESNITPAALDVIAHEYTHAFIKRNPNLNPYRQNIEAGALNEGFADIFGLLAERKVRGWQHYWMVGDDIGFSNPSVRSFPYGHISLPSAQPEKYQESGYWDFTNAGKHKNAGVLTHWFYLLSMGGTYNNVTLSGVGIEQADDISFTTMMWWLWGNCNYMDTRNQSIYATIADWGGYCSKNHKEVLKAWASVGLGTYNINCKPYIIIGDRVAGKDQLPSVTPLKLKVVQSDPEEGEPEYPIEDVQWIVPETWDVNIDADEHELTFEGATDYSSVEIKAVVSGDDHIDTLTHIVHFVDCSTGECEPAMLRRTQPQLVVPHQVKATIYPNPVTDESKVTIMLSHYPKEDYRVDVYSVEGKRVISQQLSDVFTTVSTRELAGGIYIFKVSGNDLNETIRVIVSNK